MLNLTDRETDVIELLSQGLSDKEIAKRLVVSVTTVHAHKNSIYSKIKSKIGDEKIYSIRVKSVLYYLDNKRTKE